MFMKILDSDGVTTHFFKKEDIVSIHGGSGGSKIYLKSGEKVCIRETPDQFVSFFHISFFHINQK